MPIYCEDCPVPVIREFLVQLKAEQALDKALLRANPAKDSTATQLLQSIIYARAKLIEIKENDFQTAHPGCPNCTA